MSEPSQPSSRLSRLTLRGGGALLALLGAGLLTAYHDQASLYPRLLPIFEDLVFLPFGWGALAEAVKSGVLLPLAALSSEALPSDAPAHLWLLGGLCLVGGLFALGLSLGPSPAAQTATSEAAGAPLYPPIADYRDFHWGTLAAYGGGMFAAELAIVLIQVSLAPHIPAVAAFSIGLLVSFTLAFLAGFFGAARSRRLSMPEATLGVLYFGMLIPVFLTLLAFVPALNLAFGFRLREVIYLASLLGRPEVSYWLGFTGLLLMLVLGITSGFVATGSGKLDLRTGFELFVARRHVEVFRPSLLLGGLAVLMLGILPPLLILGIVRATHAAVERTRIKRLGLVDPLLATAALHQQKLREQTPTAMMTALSVGGVGVGVMALIIVLSVMSGFELDLQKKILGTNAHAVVLKYTEGFPEFRDTMTKVRATQGVTGVTPFIMNEVMISSEGNISGVVIKGIDPQSVGEVTDLPQNIQQGGSLDWLIHPEKIERRRYNFKKTGEPALDERASEEGRGSPEGDAPERKLDAQDSEFVELSEEGVELAPALPGVILGRELASSMKVVVGDRLNVVSPLGGELGPHGPTPKSRPFRVAGIFYSGMYEYDSKFVYITLSEAQSFFNVKGVTGLELKLADIDDARRLGRQVLSNLEGYPYRVRDWGEMNKNLFSALRLEKLVMAIILSIIVIVAGGLIVATVIMLVLEKRKEISVLKALGVSDGGIVKIFLAEGLQIGVAGGLLGLVSGLSWCLFIERVGIKLDPEVYYIPSLPVKIEPLQTAIPVVIAVLVTYLASIYPALKASRVEPVEGLKAE